jgi:hypothetical protein
MFQLFIAFINHWAEIAAALVFVFAFAAGRV